MEDQNENNTFLSNAIEPGIKNYYESELIYFDK